MAASDTWKDNAILKKIYVGNLKEDTDEDKLKEYFGQYGEIQETKLIRYPDGKSRKCAFITFNDCDVVDNILFNFESHNIDTKTVDVRRAIPREDPDPLAHIRTKKLFVGGLKDNQTEEDIKTALATFIPFEPTSIRLMREKETNRFKGFAFVNFENENIVDKLFLIRKIIIKEQPAEMKKAAEMGGGGPGGGRGGPRGGRGGQRGGSGPRGGGRGGRGGGGGYGGGGMGDYGGYPGGGYEGYSGYGGYENYNRGGYGGHGGHGGQADYYGNGYGGGYGGYGNSYGGGGSMGQYSQEQSGYGPSRGRGRGGRGGGGGGYRPY